MNEDKEGRRYMPSMEGYVDELGHLLPELKTDQASSQYLDENFGIDLEIDDISSIFHYGMRTNSGGLDSNSSGEGRDELSCGGFDEMLHEDEVADLHPTLSLTNACEDYFLDVDFTKKVPELDYDFCEESWSGNSRSESHSPGSSNEATGVTESGIVVPENLNDQFEPAQFQLNSVSGGISAFEMQIDKGTGKRCSDTCELKGIDEANPIRSLLRKGKSRHKKEKNMNAHYDLKAHSVPWKSTHDDFCDSDSLMGEAEDIVRNVSNHSSDEVRKYEPRRQNRMRKPTRRLIEELAQLNAHQRNRKERFVSSAKRSHLGVRTCSQHARKGTKAMQQIYHAESPGRSPRPVPFNELRESSVKYAIMGPDSDEEYDPACSSSSRVRTSKRGSDRRKHNKLWSLSEVAKLVDGISQFGVGKWTAIRKTYFSSSSYRTSLDIRDKWRNLLRASYAQLKCNNEDEQARRNGSLPLPKSLLLRVNELASIHPYPRLGSKLSRTSQRDLDLAFTLVE